MVEVSSFQLEDVHSFRPAVGVFLNLTPDHLDRHGTMERYLACKAKLFAKQGPGTWPCSTWRTRRSQGWARVWLHGRTARGWPSSPSVSAAARRRRAGRTPDSCVEEAGCSSSGGAFSRSSDILLPGLHNLENCLAAGTAALARGVDGRPWPRVCAPSGVWPTGWSRQEWSPGVTYVNDSKATNVDATLTA